MFNFFKNATPSASTKVKAYGTAQVLGAAAAHKMNGHLGKPGAKLAAKALGALTQVANNGYRKAAADL